MKLVILIFSVAVHTAFSATINCADGVSSGDSCFFLLDDFGYDFEAATKACEKADSHLAYINDLDTFRTVEAYFRDQLLSLNDNYMYFWVGATYDAVEKQMTLLSGETSEWEFVWYFGFPIEDNFFNRIAWGIRDDPADPYQGYFNTPDYPTTSALCQRN